MSPYGSAVIECQAAAFVVSAGDRIFTEFAAGDDPAADLHQARSCAASLAERVFVSSSVDGFWATGIRPGTETP